MSPCTSLPRRRIFLWNRLLFPLLAWTIQLAGSTIMNYEPKSFSHFQQEPSSTPEIAILFQALRAAFRHNHFGNCASVWSTQARYWTPVPNQWSRAKEGKCWMIGPWIQIHPSLQQKKREAQVSEDRKWKRPSSSDHLLHLTRTMTNLRTGALRGYWETAPGDISSNIHLMFQTPEPLTNFCSMFKSRHHFDYVSIYELWSNGPTPPRCINRCQPCPLASLQVAMSCTSFASRRKLRSKSSRMCSASRVQRLGSQGAYYDMLHIHIVVFQTMSFPLPALALTFPASKAQSWFLGSLPHPGPAPIATAPVGPVLPPKYGAPFAPFLFSGLDKGATMISWMIHDPLKFFPTFKNACKSQNGSARGIQRT